MLRSPATLIFTAQPYLASLRAQFKRCSGTCTLSDPKENEVIYPAKSLVPPFKIKRRDGSELQLINFGRKKCSRCKTEKEHLYFGERTGAKRTFRNSAGKRWDSGYCPECRQELKTAYRRRIGERPRDEVTEHCNKKGRESELIAKKYFEGLGFKVGLVDVNGPDLIIQWHSLPPLTVEVKSVVSCRGSRNSWKVCRVEPSRINDDYIAMVFNGRVIVRPMKNHLKQCSSDGSCFITDLIVSREVLLFNKKPKKTKSGFSGVISHRGMWRAYIYEHTGKQKHLGYFDTPEKAAMARDEAAKKIFGKLARLNFPNDALQTREILPGLRTPKF